MIFSPHLPITLLLQATLCLASAATNYSVDDQDPLFHWSGSWQRVTNNLNSAGGNLDMDEGHMLTYTSGSSATITYTFASVYFLSTLWPYAVSTDYAIDGNAPMTIDMTDHSGVTTSGGNGTGPSGVVGSWTSTANQEHTIYVTIPPGGDYAVVDMFIFEVLDSSSTSSTISSTSQTSSSTGTTSGTAFSFSSSSSTSSSSSSSISSSSSSSSSGSQGPSLTIERNLAISMGVVGTLLGILLVFLLWRFCIRRKGMNGRNMNPITRQYHQIPAIPENGTHIPLNDDNSVSMKSDGAISLHGPGMDLENNDLKSPPITLSHDRGTSSYSDLPPTLYANQSTSPLLYTQQIHHNPQRRISTPSMMTDRPPMYSRNPTLDESASVSSSSIGNTDEKRKSPRVPANTLSYTAMAKPEDALTSTAIPGRREEDISVWDNGYPQPLRFVSIG